MTKWLKLVKLLKLKEFVSTRVFAAFFKVRCMQKKRNIIIERCKSSLAMRYIHHR